MFSIYVHIPFCLKKCDYCDFHSVAVDSSKVPWREYLRAILGQLEQDSSKYGLSGTKIRSIYFGGGTPSLMPPGFFSEVVSKISSTFSISDDVEISSEANPVTADIDWLRGVREAGINRVSIGVQSFSDRLLKNLGRLATKDDVMRTIAEAQDQNFKSVSVDLIYAIPTQTMPELEDDVRTAMMFQPEHISAYQLTLEEDTRLFSSVSNGEFEMLSDENILKHMRIVTRMLSRGGWKRYEISNYAKDGFECRHNLNYWRYGEYLGLGSGAVSFMKVPPPLMGGDKGEGETTAFALRISQDRNIDSYIYGKSEPFVESIDRNTAMAEFCFMALRTTGGISVSDFESTFSVSFDEVYRKIKDELVTNRLLVHKDDRVYLTEKGVEISNQVFEKFLI